MKKSIARVGQAWSKLIFCLRVADDPGTFLRLLVQSKILAHHQKSGVSGGYDPTAKALSYHIRFHGVKRTIFLRTYAGDIRMFYEIFWDEVYRLPSGAPGASPVIVDAGANIGMTSLYFSILYPGARIFCIEPDAGNFGLLEQNMAAEGKRVVSIGAALYDRDGRVGFASQQWAYNSRIDEGGGDVRALRLDSLLDEYRLEKIDLLKIDIEGAEDKLFAAGTDWLDRVEMILVEVHSPKDVDWIGRKLVENGFYWQRWGRADGCAGQGVGQEAEGGAGAALYLASRREIIRLVNG
jgi:FkbM family methyltransferase